MATKMFANNGLDNMECIKPLPDTMLTWDHWHPYQYNLAENMQDVVAKIII